MLTSFANWLITARIYILGILGALTFYTGFEAGQLQFVAKAPYHPALSDEVRATSELYLRSFGQHATMTVAVASTGEGLAGANGIDYLSRLRTALAGLPGASPDPADIALSANEHVAVVTQQLAARTHLEPAVITDYLSKAGFTETSKGSFRIALLEPQGPEHERARDRDPMLLMAGACLLMLAAGLLGYTGSFALTGAALLAAIVGAVWQLGLWRVFGGTLTPDAIILFVLVSAMTIGHAFPYCRAVLRSLSNDSDDPVSAAVVAWPRTLPYAIASLIAAGLAMSTLCWMKIPSLSEHAVFAALGLFCAAPAMGLVLPMLTASVAIDRPVAVPGQVPLLVWRRSKRKKLQRAGETQHRVREVIAILCGALAVVAGLNASSRPLGPISAASDALDPTLAWSQIADAAAGSPGSPLASFVILGRTEPGSCARFDVIDTVDRLSWTLRNLRGVVSVNALPDALRRVNVRLHENDLRWSEPPRNPLALVKAMAKVPISARLYDSDCGVLPITVFVAAPVDVSVARVIDAVTNFAAQNATMPVSFSLAAGPLASAVSEHLAFARHETAVLLATILAVTTLAFLILIDWRGAIGMFITFGLTLLALGWTMAARQIGLGAEMAPLVLLAALLPLDAPIYLLIQATKAPREAQALVWRRALRTDGRTLVIRACIMVIAFGAWTLSPDYRQAATGLLAIITTVVTTAAALVVIPAILGLIETAFEWREHPRQRMSLAKR